jgi:hypothetical protein
MLSRRAPISSAVRAIVIAGVALCSTQIAACGSSSHVNGPDGGAGAGGAAGGPAGMGGGGAAGASMGGQGGADAGGAGPEAGADAGIACGDLQCDSNQVCVRQSCGGALAVCAPPEDGGTCPTGWSSVATCPGSGRPGCVPPPCSPPPPKCVTIPAACHGTATCGCLPFDICTSGTCISVLGGQAFCASS